MTRHCEAVMGTVVSLDIRTPGNSERLRKAVNEVVNWLHWVDGTFSTYLPDSEISRLGRGELALADCHQLVREVLATCEDFRVSTRGYFDARAVGRLDPSGLVKGWAIERASVMLVAAGWPDHAIDGGGDVRLNGRPDAATLGQGAPVQATLAQGTPAGSTPKWQVALRHPFHPGAFCAIVALGEGAVATSGTYERGQHVIDPHLGKAVTSVAALTVIGSDLASADAYATAGMAMGLDAPRWLATLASYESILIDAEGNAWESPGFARYRAVTTGDRRVPRQPDPGAVVSER